ncbi:type II toxin-antitoxin system RelE/ParE family toxin [Hyphomicrobium sp.]|jgi:proteic killer suppression protein|uniref:type II toxin-antitoxin system RelE/ParE family toxin n=1 Tax=Hyphomicrobium sp. TaxID=82 RepID=UPI002FDFA370
MIKTWANSATERFAVDGKSKFSGMDEDLAFERLAALDAAEALSDLSPLKSLNLHPLKGNRKGQWAININGPWRICFRFKDGNAWEVEITDYH